jgi:hypothetical protein
MFHVPHLMSETKLGTHTKFLPLHTNIYIYIYVK